MSKNITKPIILKDNGINIEIIYHISDIHIRINNKREEEYKQVFYTLFKMIEHDKPSSHSLIVITGDSLHNNQNLKSCAIVLFKKFLDGATNLATVIMI